nr:MAG TPA: hypothetical protein [Caudoviricetes sp.]
MAEKGLVTKSYLTATADAIRAKLGTTTKYKPSEFADAIGKITGGGTSSGGVNSLIGYCFTDSAVNVATLSESKLADYLNYMGSMGALATNTSAPIMLVYTGATMTDTIANNLNQFMATVGSYGFVFHLAIDENLSSNFTATSNLIIHTFS